MIPEAMPMTALKTLGIVVWLSFAATQEARGICWPVGADPYQQYHVSSTFGQYRPNPPHFHDGIDIGGADGDYGSPVYAVESGYAETWGTGLRVGYYTYDHVSPTVNDWEYIQYRQQIGTVNGENHLHFSVGYDQMEENPLGVLYPFSDDIDPTIHEVKFYPNGITYPPDYAMDPMNLHGAVDIVAKCSDAITGGGTNVGIYQTGYEVFDGSEPNLVSVYGPVYNIHFEWYPGNECVPYVYSAATNISNYYYIATNGICYDSYLDVSSLENAVGDYDDGYYRIKVYAEDIDQGFQETLIPVFIPELGIDDVTMVIRNQFGKFGSNGGVVEVNDAQYPSPFEMICAPGQSVEISAVSPQWIDGKRFRFQRWSDGGQQTHVVEATEITHTAFFVTREHTTEPIDDIDENGQQEIAAGGSIVSRPLVFSLSACTPNPFGSQTSIPYSLKADCSVTLRLYDSSWQLVRTLVAGTRSAGQHTIAWDGRDDMGRPTPNGVYYCRMEADEFKATSKVILLR